MTNREKSRLMVDLACLWLGKAPQLRFMQLICNFQSWLGQDGFYIPDEKLIEMFEEYLRRVTRAG